MTVAEQIRQRGITEGEGRGRIKTGGIMLRLVKRRFGSISPLLEQKLMQSDFDVLDRFGESIFDFRNLKDAEKWWDDYGKEGNA